MRLLAITLLAITLLASALLAMGCGGHRSGGYMPPGVRERIVSVVPIDQVPVLPQQVPRWGDVRIGVVGGVATADRAKEPRPDNGQRHTPSRSGELFVGLGMPGSGQVGETITGWEVVGGATAEAAPAERGHALEPTLVAPDRDVLGGYLRINGLVGTEATVIGASFAVRAAEIAFAWDYGDCGGGHDCLTWYRKGEPATGEDLAWGVGGSVTLWRRVGERGGLVFGAGFEVPPSIETDRRDEILCDANGNCTGGGTPATPDATMGGEHRQVVLGADFQPAPWARAFVLLVQTTVMASHAFVEQESFVQVRAGLEASF